MEGVKSLALDGGECSVSRWGLFYHRGESL